MKIVPWSPDPDKYADECQQCSGAGTIALNGWVDELDSPFRHWAHTEELCSECEGTGITVDWTVVEPALLGERQ